jgi:sugar lactone lactonase YvrE
LAHYSDRYIARPKIALALGWSVRALTPPSALFGTCGIRLGPDGRLYVAETFANRISAIDLSTREISTICDVGGPILAPDDMAFDSSGTMYVPDVMGAQVCARSPNGEIRTIARDVPCANGITVYQDRVFMDECRPQGRVVELFADGSAPKVMAQDLPAPNALAVGPDGYLYFPLVTENEIWRLPLSGGTPERFVGGLAVPTAVKFDQKGNLVTVQAASGEVLKFDLQTGARSCIARLRPGLDNLDIAPDGRLFVSHYLDGGVEEVLADGSESILAPAGMLGPYGLAVGNDGALYAADGLSMVSLTEDGRCVRVGHRMDGQFPGWVRDVAAGDGNMLLVTTAEGNVTSYDPHTHAMTIHQTGRNELYGVAMSPTGSIIVNEGGEGAVLEISGTQASVMARGLARPTGLAVGEDGTVYVAEADAGRVTSLNGSATTLLDGLIEPHGVAITGNTLFVVDAGARQLVSFSLATGKRDIIASHLPVGAPPGTIPRILPGIPQRIPGPLSAFAGITAGADGTLYLCGNGNGSLMAFSSR